MRISVWDRGLDDNYLKLITQLGADAIDFGTDSCFPSVQEQGCPDFDELLLRKRFTLGGWKLIGLLYRISVKNS